MIKIKSITTPLIDVNIYNFLLSNSSNGCQEKRNIVCPLSEKQKKDICWDLFTLPPYFSFLSSFCSSKT